MNHKFKVGDKVRATSKFAFGIVPLEKPRVIKGRIDKILSINPPWFFIGGFPFRETEITRYKKRK